MKRMGEAARKLATWSGWTRRLVAGHRNRRRDRGPKADLYLRAGVPHYWIVDPDERTLEAFAAEPAGWLRIGAWSDGDEPRFPPFEAIALDVGRLFLPLD